MKAPSVPAWVALLAAFALGACDNMKHQENPRALEQPRPIPAGTATIDSAPPPEPPVTPALLERGRDRFTIYCAPCHGADGAGHGIIVHRGFPPPPDFTEARLRSAPDAHFYDVISRGYGVMYAYADRVPPADRWAIAGYIRVLQRARHATLADVPAADRARLEEAAP